MKRIIITVDVQGGSTIRTEGYQGADCQKASSKLEVALGQVRSDEPTPEIYQEAARAIEIRN